MQQNKGVPNSSHVPISGNLGTRDDNLALGEAEMDFATELVVWLCHRKIIGSITMRSALLELRRFNPAEGTRVATGAKPPTGGPRR